MPSDSNDPRLCYGRVVYANVERSDRKGMAGPHYCIILDSDEASAKEDPLICVVASTNDLIDDTYVVPVPHRFWKLTKGKIICSWVTDVWSRNIEVVTRLKLEADEMEDLLKMIRRHKAETGPSSKKK